MSKNKNSLLLMNVHVLYVLEDTSRKKIPSVCLFVCLAVRTWVAPNKILWVSYMYEM